MISSHFNTEAQNQAGALALLRAQRDELLAALKRMVETYDGAISVDYCEACESEAYPLAMTASGDVTFGELVHKPDCFLRNALTAIARARVEVC